MSLALVTPPAEEPVSLDDVKQHLRIEHSEEDGTISELLTSSRQYAESYTRQAFIDQIWRLSLSCLPEKGKIGLTRGPFRNIVQVRVIDSADVATPLAASNYELDISESPVCLVVEPGSIPGGTKRIEIDFTAGYGENAQDVPAAIRLAIMQIAGHWYANREAVTENGSLTPMPLGVAALLTPYREFQI